jgi:molecular chaperone DnaK (HSP70)
MLHSIGKCLLVCLTMLWAASCVSAERKFHVNGTVFDATKQPMKAVKVALLKVGSSKAMELPSIEASDVVFTDSSGAFAFKVEAKRGVLLEVLPEGAKAPDKYTVPLDKIKDGKLRVEVRVIDGKSEVRWNDEEWVQWRKSEPHKPSKAR